MRLKLDTGTVSRDGEAARIFARDFRSDVSLEEFTVHGPAVLKTFEKLFEIQNARYSRAMVDSDHQSPASRLVNEDMRGLYRLNNSCGRPVNQRIKEAVNLNATIMNRIDDMNSGELCASMTETVDSLIQ